MRVQSPLFVFSVCSCWCRCYVFGCVIFNVGFGFKINWLLKLSFRCALNWVLRAVIFLLLIMSLGNSNCAASATSTSVTSQGLVSWCDGGLILINNSADPAIVGRFGVADVSFFDSDTLFFNDLGLGCFRSVLRFSGLPSSLATGRGVGRS